MPEGASSPVGDVITMGAGEQFISVYDFAHQNGYRVVGGSSSTVGIAGGWLAAGGHGLLSNELGKCTIQRKVYEFFVYLHQDHRYGCRQCTTD